MFPCVCSVTNHRRRQNVVRTSVAKSVNALCATFLSRISRMTGSEFLIHLVHLSFSGVMWSCGVFVTPYKLLTFSINFSFEIFVFSLIGCKCRLQATKQQFERTLLCIVEQEFRYWRNSSDRTVIKREWFN